MGKKFKDTSVTGEFNKNADPLKIKPLQKITGFKDTEAARQLREAGENRVIKGLEDLPTVTRPSGPGGPGKGAS